VIGDPCLCYLLATKTSDHRGMRIRYDHLNTEHATVKRHYAIGRLSVWVRLVHVANMASQTVPAQHCSVRDRESPHAGHVLGEYRDSSEEPQRIAPIRFFHCYVTQ
jgi:hypothetical protein